MGISPTLGVHIARPKIVSGDQLKPGDIVSDLPEALTMFGLVCNIRGENHLLRLVPKAGSEGGGRETINHLGHYPNNFLLFSDAKVVPFVSPASFGAVGNSRANSIALIGDRIAFFGFYRSAGLLIDVETGEIVERNQHGMSPTYLSAWDLIIEDADEDRVSILEVRPD